MKTELIYPDGIQVTQVELVYKSKIKHSDRYLIGDSRAAFKLFLDYWDMSKIDLLEEFKVIFLNRGGRVLAMANLTVGGISGTVVDQRHVISIALKLNAVSLIACHNHPGGSMTPSDADKELTRILMDCGAVFQIKLLDHIIISSEKYFSFADHSRISNQYD